MAKRGTSSGGTATARRSARGSMGATIGGKPVSAANKHLVIVESPAKAKTINKYLGPEFVVMASVGHVRDLPSNDKEAAAAGANGEAAPPKVEKTAPAKRGKGAKGAKTKKARSPVPGVDLNNRFKPTYIVMPEKKRVIADLKKAAKESIGTGKDVWFATDLDREGEAIAWHLAEELNIDPHAAKRVVFAAITKQDIDKAFRNPHAIDLDRVNAQQARRILDRIVGYQVSPLLWKKVARGLSAGRVQSVAVRLIVERERDIRAFIPDEYWQVFANFTPDSGAASTLREGWAKVLAQRDEKGNPPTLKDMNAWIGEHGALRAELVEVDGEKFEVVQKGAAAAGKDAAACDLTPRISAVLKAAGAGSVRVPPPQEQAETKGCARWLRAVEADIDPRTPYTIQSVETKRTTSRPPPPFITSTLQQAGSTRLGFAASRTMRAAQNLYEGIDLPGEGPVGLITYMRTDSTHLSGDAVAGVRDFITQRYGGRYVPEKPNFFTSSNKAAQEAHEAIRPTSLAHPPSKVKNTLKPDQFRVYQLIWDRFVACQMASAEWDSTAITIRGGAKNALAFRATGRTLVFDGFYKVMGVPHAADEQTLPPLRESQALTPFAIQALQKFTSPPARYTEASLIKTLESEGIGRPSTYASIIQVIQDRKYVELLERRFFATDLGEVVTDMLIDAFPRIMDVGYTREMEHHLDQVEEEHLDWIEMLQQFYDPFKDSLEEAMERLGHAKAAMQPAPKEYRCPECGSDLVYRFGKNGRFLSCSRYPDCKHASPIDRSGKPRTAEIVDVRCPKTGRPMVRRTGRFGPFLATQLERGEDTSVGLILNIDRKGHVTAPSVPPYVTDLPCPTCGADHPDARLNLRGGVRGPWLGCNRFPKCRGRGKWAELPEARQKELVAALEAHERANPVPIITTLAGQPLTDAKGKPLPNAPTVEALVVRDARDTPTIGPRAAENEDEAEAA